MTEQTKFTHRGSCHCGAVRFEVTLEGPPAPTRCNCSICHKAGVAGELVKPAAFTLTQGEDDLATYTWGAKVGTRYACRHCAVLCFSKGHLAELGGDFVSYNVQALDDVDANQLTIQYWDGRHDNWQAGPRPTPWPIFTEASRARSAV